MLVGARPAIGVAAAASALAGTWVLTVPCTILQAAEVLRPATPGCDDSSLWLAAYLSERDFKAYSPSVNMHNPRLRRKGLEVSKWCPGDPLPHVWDARYLRPIEPYERRALDAAVAARPWAEVPQTPREDVRTCSRVSVL